MTSTQTDVSAVRYERDDDGIVTLVLDDPTANANTMNVLYKDSMLAAVQRLYDEVDAGERTSPASSSRARRRPSSPAVTFGRWWRPARPMRPRSSSCASR